MSFSQMGVTLAEEEIESAIHSISSESKPFTTKAPSHVLEALDLVSETLGMSRSAFVVELINNYLGKAYCDFYMGYSGVLGQEGDQFVLDRLSEINKRATSIESKYYLESCVLSALGLEELLGDRNA